MLGPIFSVEMLTTARRSRYFVLRVLYACVLFFFLAVTYQSAASWGTTATLSQTANVAKLFFQSFWILQLLAVLFVGPAMAAGTIAVERERRTIEYLFATDLTNREIVFGKLTARFLQIASLALVGLPILAAAMLMGGIAPEQLLAVFLVTLSTMAVVTVLAVAVSVWSQRVRDAVTRVYVVLFAVLFVPVAMFEPMARALGFYDYVQPLLICLLAVNPFTALWSAMWGGWLSNTTNLVWEPIWVVLVSHSTLTFLLAALAVWAVRRVHLRDSGKAPAKVSKRKSKSRSPWERCPLVWKELATARSAGKMGWLGRIAGALIIVAAIVPSLAWYLRSDDDDSVVGLLFTSDFLACIGLLLVATRAATSITSEREKDTWITLLSSPVSTFDIVLGKAVGSLYAGRVLLLIILGLMLLQILREPIILVSIPFTLATLGTLALFTTALGMLFSLKSANSTRALGWTLGTSLFIGGGYLFCCVPFEFFFSGDWEELILALCIPLLYFVPSIYAVEGDPPGSILFAYAVGVSIYALVALAGYSLILAKFDAWNGRVAGNETPNHGPSQANGPAAIP